MSSDAIPGEDERSKQRATARRALDLAGRALDDNLGAPDIGLARLLLEQAASACAAAGAEADELTRARARLEVEEVTASTLRDLEARLAAILGRLTSAARPKAARWSRTLAWLLGSLLGLAVVLMIPLLPGWSSRGARFITSSTTPGFAQQGKLGRVGPYGLLFHTEQQKQPWVEVDLERERPVSVITVVNRSDCCTDRAVPLAAEIAGEDRQYREVGRRSEDFQTWTLELPAGTTARSVRLVAHKPTMLHLQEIRIR